jgi:hypothetical protein
MPIDNELNKKYLRLNVNEHSWLINNIYIDYFNHDLTYENMDKAAKIYAKEFDSDDKKFINRYIKERLDRLNYDLFKNRAYQKELNETYRNLDVIHHFIQKTDIWRDIYFGNNE